MRVLSLDRVANNRDKMKILLNIGLVALLMAFAATSAEAQSRVVIRENGTTIIDTSVKESPREQRQRQQEERRAERQARREYIRRFGRKDLPRRCPGGRYDPIIHVFRPGCS